LRGEASRWFGYLKSLPHKGEDVGIALFWGCYDAWDGNADEDGTEALRWLHGTEVERRFLSEMGTRRLVRMFSVKS